MTRIVSYVYLILLSFIFTYEIPISYKYEFSFGYEDNFMRFSDNELNTYHVNNNSNNDYLGDATTYDSGIIGSSLQIKLSPDLNNIYKTNLIFTVAYAKCNRPKV